MLMAVFHSTVADAGGSMERTWLYCGRCVTIVHEYCIKSIIDFSSPCLAIGL